MNMAIFKPLHHDLWQVNSLESEVIKNFVYENLWSVDRLEIVPHLVKKIPETPIQGEWVFQLKENLFFHSLCQKEKKIPVTAVEVKKSLDSVFDQKYIIKVKSKFQFSVVSKGKDSFWDDFGSSQAMIRRVSVCGTIDGTGPYLYDSQSLNLSLIQKEAQDLDLFPKTISLKLSLSRAQAKKDFLHGHLDFMEAEMECVSSLPDEKYGFKGHECLSDDSHILSILDGSFGFLWMNHRKGKLQSLDIRKSLILSIKPDLLLHDSLYGVATRYPYHSTNTEEFFRFNADEARIYARKLKDPLQFSWIRSSLESLGQAQKMKEAWLKSDVDVDIHLFSLDSWRRNILEKKFDITLMRATYNETTLGSDIFCSKSLLLEDKNFQQLCRNLQHIESRKSQQKNVLKMQKYLASHAYWMPVVMYQSNFLVRRSFYSSMEKLLYHLKAYRNLHTS